MFNSVYPQDAPPLQPGDPATTDGANNSSPTSFVSLGAFTYNGAIGLVPNLAYNTINLPVSAIRWAKVTNAVTLTVTGTANLAVGDTVYVSGVTPTDYNGIHSITKVIGPANYQFQLLSATAIKKGVGGNVAIPPVDGHVDPR